jgi:hypothetical protein
MVRTAGARFLRGATTTLRFDNECQYPRGERHPGQKIRCSYWREMVFEVRARRVRTDRGVSVMTNIQITSIGTVTLEPPGGGTRLTRPRRIQLPALR